MTKHLTNTQWMRKLIKAAENDLMLQMVIVQGLGTVADGVAGSNPDKVGNALIDGHAWVAAGKRLKALVDEQYGPRQRAAAVAVVKGDRKSVV